MDYEKVSENLQEYGRLRWEHTKLTVIEEASKIGSKLIVFLILFTLIILVFAMLSVGGANYLNTVFSNSYSGYFFVAVLILGVLCLLYVLRKKFRKIFFSILLNKSIKTNS
ncbi:MAG: hypothetical protein MRY83_17985 [Flavobacteriales bacterium]|nr:hypothetical protein [Flavobacteriales bacterium]